MDTKIEQLEKRVRHLERLLNVDPQMGTQAGNPYIAPPLQTAPPPSFDIPAPVVQGQLVARKDYEYLFGAQWLPRIGAFLLVLGISYLIGLAVTRGWITPPMLFIGAIIICVGFIATGVWARNTREDFGNVLMGIGSCGLFATVAGGHVYQNLYDGQLMVTLFVLWSLVNLGYAWLHKSRTFLSIGVIGGYLAAVMPISESNFGMSMALNALITIASCLITGRHRFSYASLGIWLASGLALLPVVFEASLAAPVRAGAVLISSHLCLAAFLTTREHIVAAEDHLLAGLFSATAGVVAFAIGSGPYQGLYAVLCGAFTGALAYIFQRTPVSQTLAWIAVGLATLLAAFGLESQPSIYLLSSLTILAAVLSRFYRSGQILSIVYLSANGLACFRWLSDFTILSRADEQVLITSVLIAGFACLWSARDSDDGRIVIPHLIAWAAISRLAYLFAPSADTLLGSIFVTSAWVIYGGALLLTGFISGIRSLRYAGISALLSAVAKAVLIDMATTTPELRVATLMGVGLVLLAGGYAYVRRRADRVA